MGRYIVKRILLAILTVFIICAITFFVMNAIPGGPFNREKALSAATIEALNRRYNLDKPVPEQFLLYMKNLLHGDFGVSLKNGRNITEIIAESFPISAKLGLMAIAVALLCGTVFGSFAALMRNKLPDRIIVFFSTLFTAVPSFVLATLLLLVFCIRLAWFPVWDPNQPNYLLPVIALSAYPMAYVTRLSKSSMLDALSQDYIRTAKAKGVAKWKVIFKHALRNSLLPVITYAGPQIAYIITGSMVIETIFHRRRHRQQVCQRHYQPRLYHDHGDDHLPGNADGRGEPDLRSFVQARRPAHQIRLRKEDAIWKILIPTRRQKSRF